MQKSQAYSLYVGSGQLGGGGRNGGIDRLHHAKEAFLFIVTQTDAAGEALEGGVVLNLQHVVPQSTVVALRLRLGILGRREQLEGE